jgi:REP element-mobilizing transposase RayT
MSRGIERQRICRDDADRDKWLSLLAKAVERFAWEVLAFCLLNNHFHLFLRTPDCGLSAGMHQLNAAYVGYYNWRYRRKGPLMQGRFKSVLVENESYWLELSRYVHLNPVRAGLCERPEQWPWSSYQGYHRPSRRLDWVRYDQVLAEFGRKRSEARRAYRRFVAEGVGRKLDNPVLAAAHGFILGSDEFVARIKAMVSGEEDDFEIPSLASLRKPDDLEALADRICVKLAVDRSTWGYGRRVDNVSRAVCVYVLRRLTRATVKDIAAVAGYRRHTAVAMACARVEREMKAKHFRKKVEKLVRYIERTIDS